MEIPGISHKKTRLLKKPGFFVEILKAYEIMNQRSDRFR
jgi:hypothetical protein